MSARIQRLEAALQEFQFPMPEEAQTLLRDELLTIKQIGTPAGPSGPGQKPPLDDLADALGTLAIGEHGDVKYFGRSAGSEVRYLRSCERTRAQSAHS